MLCFFTNPPTPEISTLSLHDALPISVISTAPSTPCSPASLESLHSLRQRCTPSSGDTYRTFQLDRKSTRLNSSHLGISYAVFCLKKKKHRTFHSGYIKSNTKMPSCLR